MNLATVMGQIETALKTITGLRVRAWGGAVVQPPAALVLLPESIDYNATYGRGLDRITDLSVMVLLGKTDERTALAALALYTAGSGPKSVVGVLQGYAYTGGIVVTVVNVRFPAATYNGVEYLAAQFSLTVDGPGA